MMAGPTKLPTSGKAMSFAARRRWLLQNTIGSTETNDRFGNLAHRYIVYIKAATQPCINDVLARVVDKIYICWKSFACLCPTCWQCPCLCMTVSTVALTALAAIARGMDTVASSKAEAMQDLLAVIAYARRDTSLLETKCIKASVLSHWQMTSWR